jgi:tetratricopeptide (TPR) repeat protein
VTKREKQFLLVFLIALVYLPFFLRSSSSFLESSSLDITRRLYQANHEDWDRTTKEKLQEWLFNHPNDTDVLLTLGLMEKRQGHYPQAGEFYKKVIQQNPKLSEAHSNLGNVYLAQKQIPLAIASYQQAIDLNPDQGAYYYNLYRAYSQETFLSGKTDNVFQKARQLAPDLVDYYSEIDSPHINRQVIDEILTPTKLWQRVLAYFVEREGWFSWVFKGWFEKIPSRVPLLVPLVFLGFLIGMSSYGQTKRFLSRCPICGTPTYRLYSGTSEKEFLCFTCHRMFMQKEKLHPKVTEKKSLQVKQFQKQNQSIAKFLSLFFVGFGYVWREHPLKGLLLLFLFFIFILRFIYWNGVIPSSFVQTSPNFWKILFWEGLFLIFYLFILRKIYRLKPRFEIENGSLPAATGEKELKV